MGSADAPAAHVSYSLYLGWASLLMPLSQALGFCISKVGALFASTVFESNAIPCDLKASREFLFHCTIRCERMLLRRYESQFLRKFCVTVIRLEIWHDQLHPV